MAHQRTVTHLRSIRSDNYATLGKDTLYGGVGAGGAELAGTHTHTHTHKHA